MELNPRVRRSPDAIDSRTFLFAQPKNDQAGKLPATRIARAFRILRHCRIWRRYSRHYGLRHQPVEIANTIAVLIHAGLLPASEGPPGKDETVPGETYATTDTTNPVSLVWWLERSAIVGGRRLHRHRRGPVFLLEGSLTRRGEPDFWPTITKTIFDWPTQERRFTCGPAIGRKNISRLAAWDDRYSPKAKATRSNRVGYATSFSTLSSVRPN